MTLIAVPRGKPGSLLAFPRPPTRPIGNLPLALSSFIGREREIAEVKGLSLSGRRLLTLYGPGGAGKTRLVLAVAQDLAEEFEDGAWWVELAPLSDPVLVPRALASALGVREVPDRPLTELLAEHLEPVRQYALELLTQSGEAEETHRQHVELRGAGRVAQEAVGHTSGPRDQRAPRTPARGRKRLE